jgi:molybdate transport system regulatory protein
MPTRVTFRFDFDEGHRLGPGKIALLEAIRQHGSIAAAGRDFGMSYRRAWLLVNELNQMFVTPLVEARGGGRHGGGAELTELGRSVIALYRAAERKMRSSALYEIEGIEQALAIFDSNRSETTSASGAS